MLLRFPGFALLDHHKTKFTSKNIFHHKMSEFTSSKRESVRENFGYPEDGIEYAILNNS